eukprot:Plantae.Rhodophyta-Purpureofilum_apyrenoidigerum.ctg8066.p1 GENE.Plantae.Rhodophyta-Purpureofilum_apyrenoidigerum.ctg8066~~Plantae.Rhodophyta-Purpureofilum_apyrenoidigerum.ctg8066.p1  ORF type:complete len:302 (+),score=40.14 Plantae.Rhodophyta-Purpureofilum_apyrenoidigerum.ctg8066:370-1275(+)
MELTIFSRSGRVLDKVGVPNGASLSDLKKAFYARNRKFNPNRQRFTLPQKSPEQRPVVLTEKTSLTEQGVTDAVVFKDLGPQISWKLVFIIEYLGPLLIFPIFYLRPSFIYGHKLPQMCEQQHSAFVAFMVHYVKRELETIFLHRFSNSTMPILNVFKNSVYYWGFAASIAYFLFHPLYTPTTQTQYVYGIVLFYFAEVGNLAMHIELAKLRPKNSTVRKIPRGNAFEYVTCPNYSFEILAWIGFNIMTSTLTGWLFCAAGAVQMVDWAVKKHRNYIKEFDGQNGRELYPRKRKILIPFLF